MTSVLLLILVLVLAVITCRYAAASDAITIVDDFGAAAISEPELRELPNSRGSDESIPYRMLTTTLHNNDDVQMPFIHSSVSNSAK